MQITCWCKRHINLVILPFSKLPGLSFRERICMVGRGVVLKFLRRLLGKPRVGQSQGRDDFIMDALFISGTGNVGSGFSDARIHDVTVSVGWNEFLGNGRVSEAGYELSS